MSWRPTAVLALVVVAVLYVAYRDVTNENPNAGWEVVFDDPLPPAPADDLEFILQLQPRAVAALTLERAGRRLVTRRTAYGWTNLTNPRAVEDYVASLTKLAVILHIEEEPSQEDLAGYGLAEPQARVHLALTNGEKVDIELGNHNPSATGIYARVSSMPGVILTGAIAVWEIDKILTALAGPQPETQD